MATLKELMDKRSPESKKRIAEMAAEMRLETHLYELRESLKLSQTQIAKAMDIAQPSVAAIEQRGNDLKIATLKRYVEAMGGTLRIEVDLPDGKHVGFIV